MPGQQVCASKATDAANPPKRGGDADEGTELAADALLAVPADDDAANPPKPGEDMPDVPGDAAAPNPKPRTVVPADITDDEAPVAPVPKLPKAPPDDAI